MWVAALQQQGDPMNRMPRRTPSRILVLLGACCALGVAIALPVVASAHGGGNGNADGSVRSARATKRICQAVGVSLDGRANIHHVPAYGELTEAQVQTCRAHAKRWRRLMSNSAPQTAAR